MRGDKSFLLDGIGSPKILHGVGEYSGTMKVLKQSPAFSFLVVLHRPFNNGDVQLYLNSCLHSAAPSA